MLIVAFVLLQILINVAVVLRDRPIAVVVSPLAVFKHIIIVFLVPLTAIVAPISGSPDVSVTKPFTVTELVSAKMGEVKARNSIERITLNTAFDSFSGFMINGI